MCLRMEYPTLLLWAYGTGLYRAHNIWLDILTMYKTKEGLRAGLYLPLLFKEIDPESTGVYVFER